MLSKLSSTSFSAQMLLLARLNGPKKAATALDKLNKDCNLTAGLEAVLCIAVGPHVMLWRNIDTANGLVKGPLGIVI